MTDLEALGTDARVQFHFEELAQPELNLARVVRVDRGLCRIAHAGGELAARAAPGAATPVVGDWCAVALGSGNDTASIRALLPRRTDLARLAAGESSRGQVMAANIDTAFVVTGLDDDFSVRRIERYLILVWDGGARPAIILTKPDLCADLEARRSEVEAVAGGLAMFVVNGLNGEGVDDLRASVPSGQSVVFIGSSGAGKSTLINRLLGEERLRTHQVSQRDGRGQHTTTHRELVVMPGGGILIDTPGLREVGVLASVSGVEQAFPEILEIAAGCRFNDCRHDGEPGCAVGAAADAGDLDPRRLESFRALRHEAEANLRRRDEHERRAHEKRTYSRYRKWVAITRKRK